jgi:hypothetical protein
VKARFSHKSNIKKHRHLTSKIGFKGYFYADAKTFLLFLQHSATISVSDLARNLFTALRREPPFPWRKLRDARAGKTCAHVSKMIYAAYDK